MLYHAHRLKHAHPDLIRLCEEVGKEHDAIIICTFRNEKEQNEAYRIGNSELRWPDSAHNRKPSLAVDIAPTFDGGKTIPWREIPKWVEFCQRVDEIADRLKIKVRGGYTFKRRDYPHFQLENYTKIKQENK